MNLILKEVGELTFSSEGFNLDYFVISGNFKIDTGFPFVENKKNQSNKDLVLLNNQNFKNYYVEKIKTVDNLIIKYNESIDFTNRKVLEGAKGDETKPRLIDDFDEFGKNIYDKLDNTDVSLINQNRHIDSIFLSVIENGKLILNPKIILKDGNIPKRK